MGLAFTGNARAAANAIPAECTTQNQNSPSSQYQEPNPTNTDLNPNRVWLRDSMRDTDRFIGNNTLNGGAGADTFTSGCYF